LTCEEQRQVQKLILFMSAQQGSSWQQLSELYPLKSLFTFAVYLMKHYVKDGIKIVILRSHYILKIQSLENLPKESPYIYIWNIMNYLLFLLLKWKLKNKIIIQHPSAKPDLNNLGTHNESSKLLWPCLSFQVILTLVSHF